ncbi:c-type cytochrome [Taibaiella helva]|uniref:c-type cytochrome n=1 Tax=Taibaiella helva TaxID=2301235 RepID=UPI0013004E93|nr:cytochrome c [Taibaiella helva]
MKKYLLPLLICLCLGSGCTEEGVFLSSWLNTGNLETNYYDIDLTRDTLLHTAKGAEIRIPAGAIVAGSKKTVRLAVQEAYSIEDMVRAGLTTKSGDRPLSSGGMISIKAGDKEARIVKALQIGMPSQHADQNMQLFKGKEDNDGRIDWVDPQPLTAPKVFDTIAAGKALFENNCGSCHNPVKDLTGPSLAFIPQRRDRKWLKQFIHNSAKLIAEGDPLANCLYERWNKTAMTAFPTLTDAELESLYRYIDQESKYLNPADYPDFKASFDSCSTYFKMKAALEGKRQDLITQNGPEVVYRYTDSLYHTFEAPGNLVVPKADYSTYYQFEINIFGWYNVDAFLADLPGFVPSSLKASLGGNYRGHTNIYLVIPGARVFVSGGLLKGEAATYGFYTDDGQLPLPQGKTAFILAFTEKDDQITFGLTRFTTGRENNITVTPEATDKATMNQKIKALDFNQLSIEAKDARNADSIRKIDRRLKDVEQLKPKGSDCGCLSRPEGAGDSAITRELR